MAQAQECWQMTNKVCWRIWMVDFDGGTWSLTLRFEGLFRLHTYTTRIVLSFDLIVFLRLLALTPRISVVLPYTGPSRALQWHPQEPQLPTDLVRLHWYGYIIEPAKLPPTSPGMGKLVDLKRNRWERRIGKQGYARCVGVKRRAKVNPQNPGCGRTLTARFPRLSRLSFRVEVADEALIWGNLHSITLGIIEADPLRRHRGMWRVANSKCRSLLPGLEHLREDQGYNRCARLRFLTCLTRPLGVAWGRFDDRELEVVASWMLLEILYKYQQLMAQYSNYHHLINQSSRPTISALSFTTKNPFKIHQNASLHAPSRRWLSHGIRCQANTRTGIQTIFPRYLAHEANRTSSWHKWSLLRSTTRNSPKMASSSGPTDSSPPPREPAWSQGPMETLRLQKDPSSTPPVATPSSPQRTWMRRLRSSRLAQPTLRLVVRVSRLGRSWIWSPCLHQRRSRLRLVRWGAWWSRMPRLFPSRGFRFSRLLLTTSWSSGVKNYSLGK